MSKEPLGFAVIGYGLIAQIHLQVLKEVILLCKEALSMTWKILVTPRTFGETDSALFKMLEEENCEVIINPFRRVLTEEELASLIKDADGVIAGIDPFNEEVLRHVERLKVISRYGVGYNNVDLDLATKKGIVVTNTPGTNSSAVAELALGLMLDVARHISTSDRQIRQGHWGKFTGFELQGKTLGIIGTGQIGKRLVSLVKGFNMKLLCFDIFPDEEWARENDVQYLPLEELLANADIISLHLPLSGKTYHFISRRELSLVKKTAILVNTSRGGVLDETALYEALVEKRLAGAGLDVFEEEPSLNSPFINLENVVLSSHIGAHTVEALQAMGRLAAQNLIQVLKGEIPQFVVNPEVLKK